MLEVLWILFVMAAILAVGYAIAKILGGEDDES